MGKGIDWRSDCKRKTEISDRTGRELRRERDGHADRQIGRKTD